MTTSACKVCGWHHKAGPVSKECAYAVPGGLGMKDKLIGWLCWLTGHAIWERSTDVSGHCLCWRCNGDYDLRWYTWRVRLCGLAGHRASSRWMDKDACNCGQRSYVD